MTRYSEYTVETADGLFSHGVVETPDGPGHTVLVPIPDGENVVDVKSLTQDEARTFRKTFGSNTPDVNSDSYKEALSKG